MNSLTERDRRQLRAVIRGAQLRRVNAEDDLVRSVFGCLTPADKLFADIMELSRCCSAAALADEDSEELESWNRLWTETVKACRRRIC